MQALIIKLSQYSVIKFLIDLADFKLYLYQYQVYYIKLFQYDVKVMNRFY